MDTEWSQKVHGKSIKAYKNNSLENTESRKLKELFYTHPQKGPLLHQTLDE